MNLFVTDTSIVECAKNLDNRRLVKMVLEAGQVLASGRYLVGKPSPYKPGHKHHPICKWAGDKFVNRIYVARTLVELNDEYMYRMNKTDPHKTMTVMGDLALKYVKRYEEHPREPKWFHNSARNAKYGLDFTHMDTIEAYRVSCCALGD